MPTDAATLRPLLSLSSLLVMLLGLLLALSVVNGGEDVKSVAAVVVSSMVGTDVDVGEESKSLSVCLRCHR